MSAIDAYLRELARRLGAIAGADLVGVYVGGSYALGAYEHGRSDLDVAAVVRSPVRRSAKEAIVRAIRHESLPCPARGLEFVLYPLDTVRKPSTAAGFDLNLNTGSRMPFRADFAPTGDESHWFPIDRSVLCQCGIAVCGPLAAEVFAAVPHRSLVPIVLEAVRWHSTGQACGDDAVLNACRAWRYALEGVWSSKPSAGAWALAQPEAPPLVAQALEARHDGRRLDPTAVEDFLAAVTREIEQVGAEPADALVVPSLSATPSLTSFG